MTHPRGILLLVLACPVMTNSCTPSSDAPWSTRERSKLVLGPDGPELNEIEPLDVLPIELGGGQLRESALHVLAQAAASSNAVLRANAIEAFQHAPDIASPHVRRALADENRAVRFVAAYTVGRMRLMDVAHLLEPMLLDESGSVRAAAIYGLNRCGRQDDLTMLASLVLEDDPEVRANAAMILGELGNTSAIPMLQHAVRTPLTGAGQIRARLVNLQFAEALVRLGAVDELEVIRAAIFAPAEQSEVVAIACQMCGRLGDQQIAPNLRDLATRSGPRPVSPEVRLVAAEALARIDPAMAPWQVLMEYMTSEDPRLRSQVAATLGAFAGQRSLPQLASLLGDEHPVVQVSAAAAVLQCVEPPSHASVDAED